MKIKQVIDFVEDYSKPSFQAMWSFVINVMRPFSAGMGLRVSHLSPNQVEIVIPDWLRNKDEKYLHEATYLTAAKEGLRLWLTRLLGEDASFGVQSYHIKMMGALETSARVCFSIEDSDREIFLRKMHQETSNEETFLWIVRDENDQTFAEIEIFGTVTLPARIENIKKSKKKGS